MGTSPRAPGRAWCGIRTRPRQATSRTRPRCAGPTGDRSTSSAGGHAPTPDGQILAGGGNLAYNNGNNLGQRDVASFDRGTGEWSARPPTARGRWYPTLLSLADGRVLAVSGKNDTNGDLNPEFGGYDPTADQWVHLNPPQNFRLPAVLRPPVRDGGRGCSSAVAGWTTPGRSRRGSSTWPSSPSASGRYLHCLTAICATRPRASCCRRPNGSR